MRYFALDFETGNASPLSACALGVSIFEDGRLVGERVSLHISDVSAQRKVWGVKRGQETIPGVLSPFVPAGEHRQSPRRGYGVFSAARRRLSLPPKAAIPLL